MALNHYWQDTRLDWRPSSSYVTTGVNGEAFIRPTRDNGDTLLRIIAVGSCAALTPTQYDMVNPPPPVDAWPQLSPYLAATWSPTVTGVTGDPHLIGNAMLGIGSFQRTMAVGTGADLAYAVLFDQAEPLDVHSQRKNPAGSLDTPTVSVYIWIHDPGLFFTDGVTTFAARWRTDVQVRTLWGSLF